MVEIGSLVEFSTLLADSLHVDVAACNFRIEIIDGCHFLSLYTDAPKKFGAYADYIIEPIASSAAHEIYLIFDKYQKGSIRDVWMKKINDLYDDSCSFRIIGPHQERPADMKKCLLKQNFRMADCPANNLPNYLP